MADGLKLLDAYVAVHADASKVGDEAAKQIEGGSGGLMGAGRRVGMKFAGALAGAFAAQKVAEFIGDSISDASDLNETVSASQQIFGASAAAISSWGDTAATAMGMSKQEAIESATGFGNMFQQLGIGNAKATDMSKSLVQMASDFGSFNNLPTADVLDSISGAMRGEYDSLQRIIPNISAARVEQEALNETHKKHASSLTAAEKAQATMNIMMKDGTSMMGDFGRTSTGFANQQKIAAAQTEDLKARIGQGFLPVVKELAAVFTGRILPVLANFAGWVGKNSAIITPLVIAIGAIVAILVVWIGVQTVLNLVMSLNPIGLVVIAIGLLIAVIVILIMNWGKVVSFLRGIFGPAIAWVVTIWNAVVGRFAQGGQQIVDFIVGAWNKIIAANRLLMTLVLGFAAGLWNGVVSRFTQGGQQIVGAVRAALGFVRNLFAGIGGWARDAGVALLHGFIAGIQSMIGAVVGTVKGFMDRVAGFFPHSPALEGPFSGRGWTPYAGAALVQGFASGIDSERDTARKSVAGMMGAAAGGLTSLGGTAPSNGRYATNGSPAAVASSRAAVEQHTWHVTIDAKSVDSFTKVVSVFDGLKQSARQGVGTEA